MSTDSQGERILRLRKAGLEAYAGGLVGERKYASDRQIFLKTRVFETFDTLLRHRGHSGLKAGTRLLDVGSADGALVEIARRNAVQAAGLDVVDGIDFEKDPFPVADASLDVVTAVSVIEHLHSATNLLLEAKRCLVPGGAIIIVTPNWRYSARNFFDDPTHVKPYSPPGLHRHLVQHGFESVYVVPWLVKKPTWMWDLPKAFAVSRWLLPFRGDAPHYIPEFLRGRSGSLLAIARTSVK